MSILKTLNKDGLEKAEDRVGGGFQIYETGLYRATVDHAYLDVYGSGANYAACGFTFDDGRKYRENILLTNAAGDNFYLDKDKKKQPLMGFTIMDDMAIMITDSSIAEHPDPEERVIKAYEGGQEIQKTVDMLAELVGGTVYLAIQKKITTKMEKDANGKYTIPTSEEREENNIVKVFHDPSMLTVAEADRGLEEGEFHATWLKANEGKTQDKRVKAAAGVAAGAPRTAAAAPARSTPGNAPSAAAAPKKSLFGSKK